jgi:uncharacterized protein YeaO (DUF488 family)
MRKEVHLHCAVTAAGDPHGITEESRKDEELNQWAARIPPDHWGRVKKAHVRQMFNEFYNAAIDEMRRAGILANGE